MAAKGGLCLKMEELRNMYTAVSDYGESINQALYDQYKKAYKITLTNHLRGTAADAFKQYFSEGTVNMIQGMMDVVSEMTETIQFICEFFYQCEGSKSGVIWESTLDEIGAALGGKQLTYDDFVGELESAMAEASNYISTVPLDCEAVDEEYSAVGGLLTRIREDLYTMDEESVTVAGEFLDRISELKTLISNTMGLCYKDGVLVAENLGSLSTQPWYAAQTNLTLSLMLEEDPFEYDAGNVCVSEEQWTAGLCPDVYAYAGYSWLSASYEYGVEDGTAFAAAAASVFEYNGYAQLTDYIKAEYEEKFCYAEAEVKAGAGDGYIGFHLNGEVGLLEVSGSVMAGDDNFNVHATGTMECCCADAKVACEFDRNDGTYAVGLDASATAAELSGDVGIGFLSFDVDDGTATSGATEDLFRLSVSGSATVGAGICVMADSVVAYEFDNFNINATTIKIGAEILGGGSLNITIPTIYVKWPW